MKLLSIIRHPFSSLPLSLQQKLRRVSLSNYLVGLILSIALGGGYMAFAQGKTQAQTPVQSIATVARRTITSSINATGNVTFSNEQQMQFNQKGTVTAVNFKVGDAVKKGDVIAKLDDASVQAQIRQQQLSISAAELQLKQLEADKNGQIQSAQNSLTQSQQQLTQAQNNLAVTQQKLPSDLASAQRAVQEKQTALTQAQLNLTKAKSSEILTLATTAQTSLSTSDKLLDSFYSILTRGTAARPTQGNYDLTIDNLLYNDPNLARTVKNDYLNAINAANAMHQNYGSSLATQQDPETLVKALADADTLAKDIYMLGEDTYSMMQGATVDTSNFTASDVNTSRSTVSGNISSASSLVSQVETAQADLAATSSNGGIPSVTLKAAEDAVTTAQNDLTTAQENLKELQTSNPATLTQQQQAVDQAQNAYKAQQLNANSTNTDLDVQIALKQNAIAQSVTSLQSTEKSLENYELVAPFDGTISHLDYKVGDNLLDTGNTTEMLEIQNTGTTVVTVPLDQVDVVNVKAGMPAIIAFDAIPGKTFQGSVDSIDSTPVQQSGVVSYNVAIKLPTPDNMTILSGMTATVTITTASAQNVLAVPNLALQWNGSNASVRLSSGQLVPVKTGATDGQYTEITSGLTEGQQIQSLNISQYQTSSNGQNPNAQIFRLGGGGGFGGGATFTRGGGGGGFRGGGG
ncbi:MAG TPA: efflux RND transporter periplasmic adaptor subunit [Candidatus Peribacteraceae bacterium]|nr:efflux RND transporter periplasmic adaptor subunit [Candidatus Peribacteraceae bacterium]